MITIKIAGIAVGIDNRFTDVEKFSRDYLTDDAPDFTVSVSDDDIEKERVESATDLHDGYYEFTVAYRKIAERLHEYDAFLFHGCVLDLSGDAYVITAHSGVGKTTHTRLWLREFEGEVSILNGDKPIIRIIDGVPYACGTPWQGKERYGKNAICPLRGFAFLSRSEENRATEISAADAVTRFMTQIYLPKGSQLALVKTMRLADRVLREATLVRLECNMEPDAAHVCRAALTKNGN
ncbi:MAG: hypothetical protein J6V09_05245 [Clostridia bacterium]|nr:hypothetical protein [Clostridia bacterium]